MGLEQQQQQKTPQNIMPFGKYIDIADRACLIAFYFSFTKFKPPS